MEEQKNQQITSSEDASPIPTNNEVLIPKEDDISPRSMIINRGDPKDQVSSPSQHLQAIDILGAVKVRDGLFLGDEFASQDLEFVIANKVTHIINCAGRQIFNQWTPVGVKYLTFYWLDDDRQLIFDDHDQVAKEIYDFIEEANRESSGVLVHSVRGQSRACCVLSIYLMMKFRWTLLKSLEFVNSRRPNLEIRASFLQQLSAWERRTRDVYPRRTDRWDELYDENNIEEALLRNTFMNAQMQPVNFLQQWKEDVLTSIQQSARGLKQKIKWADNEDEALKKQLARENSDHDLINKDESQIHQVDNHKKSFTGKTILKKQLKKEEPKSQEQVVETPLVETKKESTRQVKQDEVPKPKPLQTKNRPVTPLLRKRESDDLVSPSPRQLQDTGKQVKQPPKRSNSSRRIDKDKEEREKRDQFKARVAWNATSPRGKNVAISNFKDLDNSMSMNKAKMAQSPSKVNSSILKKELLEKAKKALAENSKVTVGLDIKKIQETLNKIQIGNPSKESTSLQNSTQKLPPGNIINNNNINNFFIQNASVIELQKQGEVESKIQAPIGQHHHKRTNSSSMQMAQQMKQNLTQSLSVQASHRKNQLSDQVMPSAANNVPFILSTNATEQFKMQGLKRPQSQMTSKKDFKAMIRDMQKDSYQQLQSQPNFWQAQKYKQMPNQNLLGVMFPYGQSVQDKRRLDQNSIAQFRPSSSASQKQISGVQSRTNSGNRTRKLKKPQDQIKLGSQQPIHRRAQTPMPQSPTQNSFGGMLQIDNKTKPQPIVNNMLFYNNAAVAKPSLKKRSKSPSISQYQQKLQAKTAYLLMNNTTGFLGNPKQKNHSGYSSPKR